MTDTWWLEIDPPDPMRQQTLLGLFERYKVAEPLFDGDEEAIRRWLYQPNKGLGGRTPMQSRLAEVEELVGRLMNGVIT